VSPTLALVAIVAAYAAGVMTTWPHRLASRLAATRYLLLHDPLTGLPNRTGLTAGHARWVHQRQSLTLILVDLDGFKTVNDTHGHHVGDQLLAAVATTLYQLATAHGGIAARLSGDEFALLLPVRTGGFDRLAELARTLIADTRCAEPGVAVTASVGIHTADHTTPLDQLLRAADIALYHAKQAGGDTHTTYQPGMAMPSHRLRDQRRQVNP
jgi:diguanylate cyclase (GGDEF)-like protein